MPSRYVVRNFYEGGVYHVYNRGVEKRTIFTSESDYKVFMYYLFIYVSSIRKVLLNYPNLPLRLQAKNLSNEVNLISYCLMPNHFHLLIKQHSENGTTKLLKQITNAYTEYFNKKYKRDGSLMQGKFKAVDITSDELLIHVSRYIHLNPVAANICNSIDEWQWSSAKEFQTPHNGLCSKELVLNQFLSHEKYFQFMNDHVGYARELEDIKHLTIDECDE